jgi:hypothetical protein
VVRVFCRLLIALAVAKALMPPRAARMSPMARMRPGVVVKNHQRGRAGSVGDRNPAGSVDGCANSTVTSVLHSIPVRLLAAPTIIKGF